MSSALMMYFNVDGFVLLRPVGTRSIRNSAQPRHKTHACTPTLRGATRYPPPAIVHLRALHQLPTKWAPSRKPASAASAKPHPIPSLSSNSPQQRFSFLPSSASTKPPSTNHHHHRQSLSFIFTRRIEDRLASFLIKLKRQANPTSAPQPSFGKGKRDIRSKPTTHRQWGLRTVSF